MRRPGETIYAVVGSRGAAIAREKIPRAEESKRVQRLEGMRVAFLRKDAVGLVRGENETDRAIVVVDRGRVALRFGESAWNDEALETAAREGELDAWLARGAGAVESMADDARDARRTGATRAVKRAIDRVARRAEAIRGDAVKMDRAKALAAMAPWLVAEAAKAPRGAKSLKVTDWSSGEAKEIEVPLDPAKSAREQVEAMFHRAKRSKEGARIAGERLAEAERALAALRAELEAIAGAADLAGIDASLDRARAAAPREVKLDVAAPGRSKSRQEPAPPFREFVGRAGSRILVGRGAAHNDALTFHVARPHDVWLHAKDRAGAHVIVPLAKKAQITPETLVDAAHLAAHFSEARDEAIVDVQYAERRHLRKPKGSAPGFVVVDREKVIVLRKDEDVLKGLLASEVGA